MKILKNKNQSKIFNIFTSNKLYSHGFHEFSKCNSNKHIEPYLCHKFCPFTGLAVHGLNISHKYLSKEDEQSYIIVILKINQKYQTISFYSLFHAWEYNQTWLLQNFVLTFVHLDFASSQFPTYEKRKYYHN